MAEKKNLYVKLRTAFRTLVKKIYYPRKLYVQAHKLFGFVPDKYYLAIQYFMFLGRWPHLKNPQRFSEKLLWYKLYWRNPLMTQCADKYAVREYIKSQGYESILNELYAVYDSVDEIDFDALPDQFIIRTNNGDATNIICKDKSKLDREKTKKQLQYYLDMYKGKKGTFVYSRSWAYENIQPKIVVERLLTDPHSADGSLTDYKLMCFNGKVEYYMIIQNRYVNETLSYYDKNGHYLNVLDGGTPGNPSTIIPPNMLEIIKTAEDLSKNFPHVRADFYNINGKIYFGELTFYDSGGYPSYSPDSFDFEIGGKFVLPPKYL